MRESASSPLPAGSPRPTGTDPIQRELASVGLPLTRANYLRLAGLQEPLTAELEATLPDELAFPEAPKL